MMKAGVRVLVVDDSALMRQMVSRFLTEAGFDVVATARNGRLGLEQALALRPDVITLDVEMPEMDGLAMLRQLMTKAPTPVVMLSSLTQADAPTAVEALTLGAVDVVGKPGGQISLNLDEVQAELVRKVAAAAKSRPYRPHRRRRAATDSWLQPPKTPVKSRPTTPKGVVVLGCSTGGPGALTVVVPNLPIDFPWAVLVVQHMPAGFTASLANRLDTLSALRVREAAAGVTPQAGEVWLAPGGYHLLMGGDGILLLSSDPPVHGVRPAVDPTLVSVAAVWQGASAAVIMTGMGKDGARGAQAVKRAGGLVLAQDEASSVVYGMPRMVVEMGVADRILPLEKIAPVLTARVVAPRPSKGRRW